MGRKKLIKNVNVFDGRNPELKKDANIIIEDNLVSEIIQGKVEESAFSEVIDGKNRTAFPGLTDAHVHLSHNSTEESDKIRIDEAAVRSTRFARDMLMRGFTTVRDAGSMVWTQNEY